MIFLTPQTLLISRTNHIHANALTHTLSHTNHIHTSALTNTHTHTGSSQRDECCRHHRQTWIALSAPTKLVHPGIDHAYTHIDHTYTPTCVCFTQTSLSRCRIMFAYMQMPHSLRQQNMHRSRIHFNMHMLPHVCTLHRHLYTGEKFVHV